LPYINHHLNKVSMETRHNFYGILDGSMNELQLREELSKWTRESLISWLKWNDRNGVYYDEESMLEFGNILTHKEAMDIMISQIMENR